MPAIQTSDGRRDVVVSLFRRGDDVTQWLLAVPASASPEDVLAEAIPVLVPMALEAGDLDPDDGEATFGIRDADPADDVELYLEEARSRGLPN